MLKWHCLPCVRHNKTTVSKSDTTLKSTRKYTIYCRWMLKVECRWFRKPAFHKSEWYLTMVVVVYCLKWGIIAGSPHIPWDSHSNTQVFWRNEAQTRIKTFFINQNKYLFRDQTMPPDINFRKIQPTIVYFLAKHLYIFFPNLSFNSSGV